MNTNKTLLKTFMNSELESQWNGPPVDLTAEEATKYHPIKDITFLERLDADTISDRERAELLEHLDKCVFCRQELTRLCKCGAMFEDNRRKIGTGFSWVHMLDAVKRQTPSLALVACLLLVVGTALWYTLFPGSPSQIVYHKVAGMLEPEEKNFSTLSLPAPETRMPKRLSCRS